MAGIGRTIRKVIPKEAQNLDPVDKKIRKETVRSLESLSPKVPKVETEDQAVIPMPDADELERARRRRANSRRGSRASTVLTDDDQLGP